MAENLTDEEYEALIDFCREITTSVPRKAGDETTISKFAKVYEETDRGTDFSNPKHRVRLVKAFIDIKIKSDEIKPILEKLGDEVAYINECLYDDNQSHSFRKLLALARPPVKGSPESTRRKVFFNAKSGGQTCAMAVLLIRGATLKLLNEVIGIEMQRRHHFNKDKPDNPFYVSFIKYESDTLTSNITNYLADVDTKIKRIGMLKNKHDIDRKLSVMFSFNKSTLRGICISKGGTTQDAMNVKHNKMIALGYHKALEAGFKGASKRKKALAMVREAEEGANDLAANVENRVERQNDIHPNRLKYLEYIGIAAIGAGAGGLGYSIYDAVQTEEAISAIGVVASGLSIAAGATGLAVKNKIDSQEGQGYQSIDRGRDGGEVNPVGLGISDDDSPTDQGGSPGPPTDFLPQSVLSDASAAVMTGLSDQAAAAAGVDPTSLAVLRTDHVIGQVEQALSEIEPGAKELELAEIDVETEDIIHRAKELMKAAELDFPSILGRAEVEEHSDEELEAELAAMDREDEDEVPTDEDEELEAELAKLVEEEEEDEDEPEPLGGGRMRRKRKKSRRTRTKRRRRTRTKRRRRTRRTRRTRRKRRTRTKRRRTKRRRTKRR